jgi:hypothetical protein
MKDEEITVTISVAIKTFENYVLTTNKTKEEVMKDIKAKGIEIINDNENYSLDDYEICHNTCSVDKSILPTISIDHDDEFEVPFNENK